MAKRKIKLNLEISGLYKVVGDPVSNVFMHPVFGVINFPEMTAKQAKALAASERFPYLEALPGKTDS